MLCAVLLICTKRLVYVTLTGDKIKRYLRITADMEIAFRSIPQAESKNE